MCRGQMGREPLARKASDLVERAWFFEQMRRAGHDDEFVRTPQLPGGVVVEPQHNLISPADDEQRGKTSPLEDFGDPTVPWASSTTTAPMGEHDDADGVIRQVQVAPDEPGRSHWYPQASLA